MQKKNGEKASGKIEVRAVDLSTAQRCHFATLTALCRRGKFHFVTSPLVERMTVHHSDELKIFNPDPILLGSLTAKDPRKSSFRIVLEMFTAPAPKLPHLGKFHLGKICGAGQKLSNSNIILKGYLTRY